LSPGYLRVRVSTVINMNGYINSQLVRSCFHVGYLPCFLTVTCPAHWFERNPVCRIWLPLARRNAKTLPRTVGWLGALADLGSGTHDVKGARPSNQAYRPSNAIFLPQSFFTFSVFPRNVVLHCLHTCAKYITSHFPKQQQHAATQQQHAATH
jgi:hypothetical protein